MAISLVALLTILWTIAVFFCVSADNLIFSVTFLPCLQNSTCPQGNPTFFNRTFALNGSLSPNITLNVGDRLQFDLTTNVTNHPLTICQNSTVPNFCRGASNTALLNTPIILAGTSTAVNFTIAGVYYYGCLNHPGMGATIYVMQKGNATSTSASPTSTGKGNTGYRLSPPYRCITVISFLAILFI